MKRPSFVGCVAWAVIGLLYFPILFVLANAFNADTDLITWGGFTTRWFGEVLRDARVRSDLVTSLEIAVASMVLSLIIAVSAALWGRRASSRQRSFLDVTTYTRMILPEVVLAVGLFVFFRRLDLPLGFGAIVIGHTVFNSAYATVIIQARLASMGPVLEEAASDLGARPRRAFVRVTLPELWPAIAAAGLLAFTFSLDDVITSSFLGGGNAETLPVFILGLVRFTITPRVNALGAIVMVLTLLGFSLAIGVAGFRRGLVGFFGGSSRGKGR